MRRMNLRDVPDDVYEALAAAASERRQSLSAFVVERLTEVAHTLTIGDYLAAYQALPETGISVEEAVDAVREARHAS